METTTLDQKMYNYFMQLNEAEKKSVVQMIKTFLHSKKATPERMSIEQYNKEIEESEAEIEKGESYTHEEVVKLSKQWVNGK
jgi:predicted transcriptional regulator